MQRFLLLFFSVFLFFSASAQQYVIKREIGGGTLAPENILASQANISLVRALATNWSKEVLVANLRQIYKVKTDGTISRIAGLPQNGYSGDNGPALNANFNNPLALAEDGAGNIYVSDVSNYRIRKINKNGIVTTIAGNGYSNESYGDGGLAIYAGVNGVRDMVADVSGNLYMVESSRIRKISKSGVISHYAGNGTTYVENGPAATSRISVRSIAIDELGNIYLGDGYGFIRKIAANTGLITTVAGTGTYGFSGDGGQATSAQISGSVGNIIVDKSNNLYFTDLGNYRIRKITSAGIISTVAGDGGTNCGFIEGNPATGCIPYPASLALSANDEVIFHSSDYTAAYKLTLKRVPTFTAFTPTKGPVNTEVTLTGTNFYDILSISVGNFNVTDYTVVNDKSIKIKVPLPAITAQTAASITVKTVSGTVSRSGFTLVPPPSITSFTPTKGTDATIVTIKGANFVTGSTVTFGGEPATSVTVESATSIKATAGGGYTGDVEVSGSTGSAKLAGFLHARPLVTSFSPQQGTSGETVDIYGRNFTQGVNQVSIGAINVKSYTVVSDTHIKAVLAVVKTGRVRVGTTSWGARNSIDTFRYIAPPTVTSFKPTAAPTGTEVLISGTDFDETASVKFGNVEAADFTVLSPTLISATVNEGATGSISVVTPLGTGSRTGFTYIPPVQLTADKVAFCPALATTYPATIDIPIRVKNFKEIASLQGSFAWDTNLLQYNSVVSLSSTLGITTANFNNTGNRLTFVWHDATAAGKTIADNTILFTIRLSLAALPNSARTAELDFAESPLPFEAAHRNLTIIPVEAVNGSISIPSATVITTNGNSNTICAGESLVLSTNATGTLQWYKDDVLITNAKSSNYTAKSSGRYKVIATTTAGCVIPSAAIRVTVNAATPVPTITFKTPVNLGDTIRLRASTVTNATNYIWTTPTGSVFYGRELILTNAAAYMAGDYTVMAVVNNCNSKPATATVVVNDVVVISGTLKNPAGKPVTNATVSLTGTQDISKTTLADGKFSFQLGMGGNYLLTPSKNNDANKANGVTAIDITFIQAHLLQKTLFDSPYKLIAADANNSGTVSAVDLVHIRRFILGTDTAFVGNRKWAFVNDNTYLNWSNPFPFTPTRNYQSLNTSMPNQNFTAVKIGDVNYDWNPLVLAAPQQPRLFSAADDVEFYHDDIEAANTDDIVIPVKVKNFRDLLALQYTLGWNKEKFDYKGLRNNTLGIEFSDHRSAEGKLTAIWNDPVNNTKTLADGSVLFELQLRRKPGAKLKDESISLTSDITHTVAYDKTYAERRIVKSTGLVSDQLTDLVKTVAAFDVWPNPSRGDIKVQLYAAQDRSVTLNIVNLLGKTVHQQSFNLVKGDNVVPVDLNKLPSGNYFVQIKGMDKKFARQIIIKKD